VLKFGVLLIRISQIPESKGALEVMITINEILDAHDRIKPFVHWTPLVHSRSLSVATGAEVYIKTENLQKTGAFKVRGAFNKMIGLKADRVITASMGNHAQAVAFAAREIGIPARIVMPVTVSIIKEEASRGYGAEVLLHGENLRESLDFALAHEGYEFIHPFDDELVIAGQGTIGLEIDADLKNIDAILAPVGGGGLIAGLATTFKAVSPHTEMIGVVSESAPSAYRSFRSGKIIASVPLPTLADGIAVEKVGDAPFKIIASLVDDIIPVNEDGIASAILFFMERTKLVTEGAGAAPLAALFSNRDRFKGKRVVLVASGGNIDFTIVDRIIRRGLVTSGRLAMVEVAVDDAPGSLHRLTGIIAGHRMNIVEVAHNRLTEDLPPGKTLVSFTVEARSKQDLKNLLSDISGAGFALRGTDAPQP
jgi:threonine dehydratase